MAKSYQLSHDSTYCYPGSDVLINKLNIKSEDELYKYERKITSIRNYEITENPVQGNFNFKHLQAIHKALFSDIYEWAGKPRTVDIAKGNMFCKPQYIESFADEIFRDIIQNNYLIDAPENLVFSKLARYMGDINALHAFREGNGRTQRQFIYYLGMAAGYKLDYSKTTADEMMEASKESLLMDFTRFERIFKDIAEPISLAQQKEFLKKASKEGYKVFTKLNKENKLTERVKLSLVEKIQLAVESDKKAEKTANKGVERNGR